MGATCAQTSCGQAVIKWKLRSEANKKGILLPDQITDTVDSYWGKNASIDTADKETAKKICKDSVEYLATCVTGKKWDESSFSSKFDMANMAGGGVSKGTCQMIVTSMTAI